MNSTDAPPTGAGARRGLSARALLAAVATAVLAILVALLGTGTTYALWNGRANVNASTVTSGSVGLTVNGSTSATLSGLDLTRLGPGQSVSTPVVVANSGTTTVSATVSGTTVTSDPGGLAQYLILTVVPSPTCTASTTGGTSGPLPGFTTTATPVLVPAPTSPAAVPDPSRLELCVKVTLDVNAPASVQGASTAFVLAVDARQVRGA